MHINLLYMCTITLVLICVCNQAPFHISARTKPLLSPALVQFHPSSHTMPVGGAASSQDGAGSFAAGTIPQPQGGARIMPEATR